MSKREHVQGHESEVEQEHVEQRFAASTAKAKPKYLVETPVIDPHVAGEKNIDVAVSRYLEAKLADGFYLVSVDSGRYIFRAV